MKQVPFLFAFLWLAFLSPVVWAQQEAVVVISSTRGEQFLARIDERRINPRPTSSVSVGRVPAGKHVLDIQVLRRGPVQRIHAEIEVGPGSEAAFQLVPGPRGSGLLLRRLDDMTLTIQSGPPGTNHPTVVSPPPISTSEETTPLAAPTEDGPACRDAMRETEVDKAIAAMQAITESEQRYSIARSAIRTAGKVMADDLTLMMKKIPSDEWRLHLAKFGYLYVCDQQFFNRVYDTFEQQESVQELQKYIATQR